MTRIRNWVFTYNLTGEEDDEPINPDAWVDSHLTYMVWQLELAPTTNQPHYQGYMEFDAQVTMDHVKVLLGNTVHLEPRRGTAVQARAYAMKEDTRMCGPWEWGTPKNQGRRTDWEGLKKDLKAAVPMDVVAEKHFDLFVRHPRGIMLAAELLNKNKRVAKTRVTLAIGPPGSGKSTWGTTNFPDAYWKSPSTKWWDGYTGQSTVVMDDFSGGWFSCSMLKRVMDNGPLRVEMKGSTAEFLCTDLYISTNFEVCNWYASLFAKHPHQYDAICRRVDRLLIFDGPPGVFREVDPQNHFIMHRTPMHVPIQTRYAEEDF